MNEVKYVLASIPLILILFLLCFLLQLKKQRHQTRQLIHHHVPEVAQMEEDGGQENMGAQQSSLGKRIGTKKLESNQRKQNKKNNSQVFIPFEY